MIDFITTMIFSFIAAFVAAFLGVYFAGKASLKALKENRDLRRMLKKLTKWNTTLVKHINERNKEMNLNNRVHKQGARHGLPEAGTVAVPGGTK
jgi:hypothetical protein